jgi:hypothetical protein
VSADPVRCGGLFAFIVEQLTVGQPGVTVDGGVEEVVTAQRVTTLAASARALVCPRVVIAGGASEHAPPATGGDLAELLTSMCTMSPLRAGSIRRITRPVGRSSQRNLARP